MGAADPPTGDKVIRQPVVPNRKPVRALLVPASGIQARIGEPLPLLKITTDRPTPTSRAVPMHSDR
jgi:hypothetical protein